MTWNEFKTRVDRELERQGASGDKDLGMIDVKDPAMSAESIEIDSADDFWCIDIFQS